MRASHSTRTSIYAAMTGAGWATLTKTKWEALAARAAATDAFRAGRSTARNSLAFEGEGWGVPTRWTKLASFWTV
jgi:hypothetical protein